MLCVRYRSCYDQYNRYSLLRRDTVHSSCIYCLMFSSVHVVPAVYRPTRHVFGRRRSFTVADPSIWNSLPPICSQLSYRETVFRSEMKNCENLPLPVYLCLLLLMVARF